MIDARLDEMATAQPLTTDPAIVDTLGLAVQSYATQLRPLLAAISAFDTQIAAVFADHPDHALFASFPGAGAVCAPRLAAAFGTDRTRWAAATELQAHAGHRARDRTQRQGALGASPPGVSEVSQADVPRIRGPVDPLLRVGAPLLRSATGPGQ